MASVDKAQIDNLFILKKVLDANLGVGGNRKSHPPYFVQPQ